MSLELNLLSWAPVYEVSTGVPATERRYVYPTFGASSWRVSFLREYFWELKFEPNYEDELTT